MYLYCLYLFCFICFFFFKQKTAYEMRMRDWSSDVCSSDLEPFRFRADRSYLVTGGLGGLGLAVADWAVARGARHLVLASRREPNTDTSARLDRLRDAGAAIRTVAADVSRATEVEALLAGIVTSMPPLAGVFHAAGVLDAGPLVSLTPERVATVMAAKITAATHLDRCCGLLDAFVLFSSAAGLLGPPGQAAHSAANPPLHPLAERRRADRRTCGEGKSVSVRVGPGRPRTR